MIDSDDTSKKRKDHRDSFISTDVFPECHTRDDAYGEEENTLPPTQETCRNRIEKFVYERSYDSYDGNESDHSHIRLVGYTLVFLAHSLAHTSEYDTERGHRADRYDGRIEYKRHRKL